MKIYQFARGYRYNTDTLLLADFAQRALANAHKIGKRRPARMLDACAGSGIIALLIARFFAARTAALRAKILLARPRFCAGSRPKFRVNRWKNAAKCQMSALDMQKANVWLMQQNRRQNAYKFEILEGDLRDFCAGQGGAGETTRPSESPLCAGEEARPETAATTAGENPLCAGGAGGGEAKKFDFIFCNPPFYSKQMPAQPHLARSRHADFLPLAELVRALRRLLASGGQAFVCYDAAALGDFFAAAAAENLRVCTLQLAHGTACAQANLALLQLRRGRCDLRVLPPFICYENGRETAELAAVYARARTSSVDICKEDL